MDDRARTGAKIRLLTPTEVDLVAWEFGGTPCCRSGGCRQKARWWCSFDLGSRAVQRPFEYCDAHAREFALGHGLNLNFLTDGRAARGATPA